MELLELGQTLEATKLNMKNFGGCTNKHFNGDSINYVSSNDHNNFNTNRKRMINSSWKNNPKMSRADDAHRQGKKTCFRCGNGNHMSFDENCPARNKICDRCSKIGHFKKMCRSNLLRNISRKNENKIMNVRKIDETDECKTSTSENNDCKSVNEYIFHIDTENKNSIKYKCNIGGIPTNIY